MWAGSIVIDSHFGRDSISKHEYFILYTIFTHTHTNTKHSYSSNFPSWISMNVCMEWIWTQNYDYDKKNLFVCVWRVLFELNYFGADRLRMSSPKKKNKKNRKRTFPWEEHHISIMHTMLYSWMCVSSIFCRLKLRHTKHRVLEFNKEISPVFFHHLIYTCVYRIRSSSTYLNTHVYIIHLYTNVCMNFFATPTLLYHCEW